MPALIARCVTFAARVEGGNKMKCLICGIDNNTCLCESCRAVTDIEKLCMDVIGYVPGSGVNPVWESICEELEKPCHFRNIAFALSADLPSPKREYIRVLSLAGYANVPKDCRKWFYGFLQKENVPAEGLRFKCSARPYEGRLLPVLVSRYPENRRH